MLYLKERLHIYYNLANQAAIKLTKRLSGHLSHTKAAQNAVYLGSLIQAAYQQ